MWKEIGQKMRNGWDETVQGSEGMYGGEGGGDRSIENGKRGKKLKNEERSRSTVSDVPTPTCVLVKDCFF